MIELTPFAISGILITIPGFFITLILLIYGKTKLHRVWTLFNIAVLGWGIGCILVGFSETLMEYIFAWKFAAFSGFLISILFYHTVSIYTEKKNSFLLIFGYIYQIVGSTSLLIFLSNTNYAAIVPKYKNMYYISATSYYFVSLTLSWIYFALKGNIDLIYYYKKCSGIERTRTLYFSIAMLIGFLGGSMNPIAMLNINIYPYGNFSVSIYCALATYALLKHNITEINIVFKKGLIYSLLIASISIVYLISVLVIERFLQSVFHYQSIILSVGVAFMLGALSIPLRNKIQYVCDKYFFKASREEILEQNKLLLQEITQTEKYKTMSTLTSGIAHEIKNPLTSIKTFCEYLPQRMNDKEFLQNFSKIVKSEVDRIDDLVHQLLDYAKPQPPSLKDTEIHKILDDTIEILSNRIVQSHITVNKHYRANPKILIKVDPNQIRQVFLNVLLNAINSMPQGGKITITTNIPDLRTNKNPVEPFTYEISIQDTGKGIAKEDLKHVFDPFFTKTDGGTGLGLPIVQSIIEAHKGKIKINSQVGVGTKVVIELPL